MSEVNKDSIIEGFAANLIRLGNECRDWAAECRMLSDKNKLLQAEVERLKEGNDCLGQMHDKEMERSAYLREQVERLEKGIQPEGSNEAVGRAVNVLLEKEKENARLKALTIEMDKTINESQAGVRYLQSEVERLKNNCEYLDQKLDEEIDKSAMLCGQVELLTKYGDVLESGLRTLPGDFPRCLANEWTAAKQGKQS